MPSFSFIVPTAGRDTLSNCLNSLSFQLNREDEVIVVGDVFDGALPQVQALVKEFGSQYRYLEHWAPGHSYGHAQINYAMGCAQGDYLSFIDDDDIYVPGAISVMRQAIAEAKGRPVLFRFLTYHGFLCWLDRGIFGEGYVGGHCLVAPNDLAKLGKWTDRYEGDWDFVEQTVSAYGGPTAVVWNETVIAIARPNTAILTDVLNLAERMKEKVVAD